MPSRNRSSSPSRKRNRSRSRSRSHERGRRGRKDRDRHRNGKDYRGRDRNEKYGRHKNTKRDSRKDIDRRRATDGEESKRKEVFRERNPLSLPEVRILVGNMSPASQEAGVDAATCLREISSLCEDKACVYIVEYEKKDPLEWQRRVALNIYVWHIPFRDNPKYPASQNWLLPCLEHFEKYEEHNLLMGVFDRVLCRSQHAFELLSRHISAQKVKQADVLMTYFPLDFPWLEKIGAREQPPTGGQTNFTRTGEPGGQLCSSGPSLGKVDLKPLVMCFAGNGSFKGIAQLLEAWWGADAGRQQSAPPPLAAELVIVRETDGASRKEDGELKAWLEASRGRADRISTFRALPLRGEQFRGVTLVRNPDKQTLAKLALAADLFVCPSLYETWGCGLRLAGALGKPVVTQDHGPMGELAAGGAGYVAKPARLLPSWEYQRGNRYLSSVLGATFAVPDSAALRAALQRALQAGRGEWRGVGERLRSKCQDQAAVFAKEVRPLLEAAISDKVVKRSEAEVFDAVYKLRLWQTHKHTPPSGSGSSLAATEETRRILLKLFEKHAIKSFHDTSCGVITWFHKVIQAAPKVNFTCADVSKEALGHNMKNNELAPFLDSGQLRFVHGSMADVSISGVDMVMSKCVYQHMPEESIWKALWHASRGAKYLLATTYPGQGSPIDIRAGQTNLRDLQALPFCLPKPLALFDARNEGKRLGLWELPLKLDRMPSAIRSEMEAKFSQAS